MNDLRSHALRSYALRSYAVRTRNHAVRSYALRTRSQRLTSGALRNIASIASQRLRPRIHRSLLIFNCLWSRTPIRRHNILLVIVIGLSSGPRLHWLNLARRHQSRPSNTRQYRVSGIFQ
jgi:hypothetical protein